MTNDMKKVSLILIGLLTVVLCRAATYNVRDYGAKGDGKCLDSKYINIAIARAEEQGGGIVILPAGTYLCGSIHLDNNCGSRLVLASWLRPTRRRMIKVRRSMDRNIRMVVTRSSITP